MTKRIPPLQVRVDPKVKNRINQAAEAAGRSMASEIGIALAAAFPEVTHLQQGLRYGKVWGTRLLEMGPEAAAEHPSRRIVQIIYDQCEKHGPRFRWEMVGGRPDDLDDTLAEWERMEDA